jgi:nicotinamide mononucleotide transporter
MDRIALTLLGVPLTWLELCGDLAGIASVWLLARKNIWNWPVGIVNTVLFFFLFARAKLYGDAGLQVVFTGLGIWGWWTWSRAAARSKEAPVRRTTSREWWLLGAATAAGWTATAIFLARRTDSPVPIWDAGVLVLSLVATYGQARKLLESWWVWIAVDVISVPLYIHRKLYPTALLYGLFMALCVAGLRAWTLSLRAAPAKAAA